MQSANNHSVFSWFCFLSYLSYVVGSVLLGYVNFFIRFFVTFVYFFVETW